MQWKWNTNEAKRRKYTFRNRTAITSLANISRSTSKLLYQSLALAEVEESIKIDTQVHNTFFAINRIVEWNAKKKKNNIIMLWFYRFLWFCFTFCYCNRWNVLAHFSIKISINFIIIIIVVAVYKWMPVYGYMHIYIYGAQPFHVHQSSHTLNARQRQKTKIRLLVCLLDDERKWRILKHSTWTNEHAKMDCST